MSDRQEEEARKAWLVERRKGIGGSDAAAVLGVSPWKSRINLYAEKIGALPSTEETEWLRWGLLLEEPARKEYAARTGNKVITLSPFTLQRHRDNPRLFATLDGLIEHQDPDMGQGVMEIKVTGMPEEWEAEPPIHYQAQLQHNMMVTGLSWGIFVVVKLSPWERKLDMTDPIFADYELHDQLLEAETKFLEHVDQRIEPPPDGTESSLRALKALHPKDNGTTIELPSVAEAAYLHWTQAAEQRKAWEKKEAEAKGMLQQMLGDASFGVLPSGLTLSYKWQSRGEYMVKASEFRVLREVGAKKK